MAEHRVSEKGAERGLMKKPLIVSGLYRMDYCVFSGTGVTKRGQYVSLLFAETFLAQQNYDVRIGDAFVACGSFCENSPHAGGNSQFVITRRRGALHRDWRQR
jgi:hypothetical protein